MSQRARNRADLVEHWTVCGATKYAETTSSRGREWRAMRAAVYNLIAEHTRAEGTHAAVTARWLVARTGIPRRTTQRVLKQLVDEGWVVLRSHGRWRGPARHALASLYDLGNPACHPDGVSAPDSTGTGALAQGVSAPENRVSAPAARAKRATLFPKEKEAAGGAPADAGAASAQPPPAAAVADGKWTCHECGRVNAPDERHCRGAVGAWCGQVRREAA